MEARFEQRLQIAFSPSTNTDFLMEVGKEGNENGECNYIVEKKL